MRPVTLTTSIPIGGVHCFVLYPVYSMQRGLDMHAQPARFILGQGRHLQEEVLFLRGPSSYTSSPDSFRREIALLDASMGSMTRILVPTLRIGTCRDIRQHCSITTVGIQTTNYTDALD
ncbi:hypothetical protein BS17DRAFT_597169 [Gyrodon lividus]|nr:hypothetical protein BS17DRAFT_597169 [Gyrodon lividus]